MTGPLDRIQWGFSSLGAPELSLQELSALRRQFDLDFLELRAVRGTIVLPDYFRAHPEDSFVQPGEVRVLSTDLRLIDATEEDMAAFMRYVDLAEKWATPYLRVFGGGQWGDEISSGLLQRAVKTVDRCRSFMVERGATCKMLLETHSGFSSAKFCRRLNDLLDQPLGILWDSHHTWKLAGEPLETSWQEIGPWVGHVHYKDSIAASGTKDGYRYVLPGSGEFPTQGLLQLLARVRYQGGVSLEWEKLWHPDLADASEALVQFQQLRPLK